MQVKSFIGGFDKNLCYLVWCKKTRLASIIDPSVESLEIFEFIESQNLILEKILITHTHRDHISYLDDFIYKYPLINIYCHANPVNNFKKIFIPLDNNQAISIGDSLLTILYTPGHFPDSVGIAADYGFHHRHDQVRNLYALDKMTSKINRDLAQSSKVIDTLRKSLLRREIATKGQAALV